LGKVNKQAYEAIQWQNSQPKILEAQLSLRARESEAKARRPRSHLGLEEIPICGVKSFEKPFSFNKNTTNNG